MIRVDLSPDRWAGAVGFLVDQFDLTPRTLNELVPCALGALQGNDRGAPGELIASWRSILATLADQAEVARSMGGVATPAPWASGMSFAQALASRDTATIASWGATASDAVRFSSRELTKAVDLLPEELSDSRRV